MKTQLIKTGSKAYYWRFVANNGNILCHSESYTRKDNAIRSLQSVATNLNGKIKEIEYVDHTS